MAEIHQLPAKSKRGAIGDSTYSITFNTATRQWTWRVVITVMPQVFEGTCKDFTTAKAEVERVLQRTIS